MAEVELTYYCPVFVTVDLEEGTVTDVQVGDENAQLDRETPLDVAEVSAAVNIATSTDWPEWRFG